MADLFKEYAEDLIGRKAASIADAAARRADGDRDFAPVEMGKVRFTMAGKAPERRVTGKYASGYKLVVEEHPPLVARIVERPE